MALGSQRRLLSSGHRAFRALVRTLLTPSSGVELYSGHRLLPIGHVFFKSAFRRPSTL